MLNWLRTKLINRRRAIYRYWDGKRFRRADPMVLYRSLMSHPKFDLSTHPQFIDENQEDRDITLSAIRDVFGVKAFDGLTGEGLTEEETVQLLWAFVSYCTAKKKSVSPSPTSPPATESNPSGPQREELDTTSPLDCGSTSPDPKSVSPPA